MQNNIISIFVIGTERSGTKWLTRIIAAHPQIAAVINDDDQVEEAYFENFDFHFPDVKRPDDYIALVELFSKSYSFEIINANKEILYRLDKNERPTNYFEMFKMLMNNYAKENNKAYWVQKASPKSLPKLIKYFPDAYFIVIKRRFIDNIKSRVANRLRTKPNSKKTLKMVYQYVYQEKITKYFLKIKNIPVIKYEDLKNNKIQTLNMLSKYLQIELKDNQYTTQNENRGHSSFRKAKQREMILTKKEIYFSYIIYYLFKLVPLKIYDLLYRNFSKSRYMMVAGTFTSTMLKYNLRYDVYLLDEVLNKQKHD